jgi:DNA-binding NtrC family response regulator
MLFRVIAKSPLATLLLVDDDPQLLSVVTRVLERSNYRVLEAKDGDEAAALLARHAGQIDGVILDAGIPPDGAPEVMRAAHARDPGLRVLLSSGESLPEDFPVEIDESRVRFLYKGYAPATLLRVVAEFFGSPGAGDDSAPA